MNDKSKTKQSDDGCIWCGSPWLIRRNDSSFSCECGNCGLKLKGKPTSDSDKN